MTAIVGFMNKRGIAMAADSAVTLGNTHKVMNSGNKIFTLSKYAPVGVATYGNDSFMETPWEIVIKLYRKQLRKRKYGTVNEYIDSFIAYLHDQNFFMTEDHKKIELRNKAIWFYNASVENSRKRDGYTDSSKLYYLDQELQECRNRNLTSTQLPEMVGYNYEEFENYFKEIFLANKNSFPLLSTEDLKTAFLHAFYQYLQVYVKYSHDSGLVFFGYGDNEIYPSMVNIEVSDAFDGRLRYLKLDNSSGSIKNFESTACIIPFAQTDVVQTVIGGINPSFGDILQNSMVNILNQYRNIVIQAITKTGVNPQAIKAISALNNNAFAQRFMQMATNEFQANYTSPLINTVANLSKEDMANLAESLVELTSLVRRMSPGEETVGGPVDVAVVTKGDGFIWLKRKHYFDPKLNTNFLNTYNDDEL